MKKHFFMVISLFLIFTFFIIKFTSIKPAFTGNYETSPHNDSTNGVNRITGEPQGSCTHCHYEHYSYENTSPPHITSGTDAGGSFNYLLFKDIMTAGNAVCFKTTGCHKETPSTYPAVESDRMPTGSTYPGYFEKNTGANAKQWGVDNRARWTGQTVWENLTYSQHYIDSNMWEKDSTSKGKCTNCHSPHGTQSTYDMLTAKNNTGGTFENVANPYTGMKDSGLVTNQDPQGRPKNYELCFSCHSNDAAARNTGMNISSKNIGSYYSQNTNNDEQSGHQIRKDTDIADSWPVWVQSGDKLDCSSCHNPHGTNNSNKNLISDKVGGNTVSNFDPSVASSLRGFCFSCHCPEDAGSCSNTVNGITMKQLPFGSGICPHQSDDVKSCYACHNNDYSTATSRNIHHPSSEMSGEMGEDCFDCHACFY